MKLRILKPATLAGVGTFKPGTVVVIPNDIATGWLRTGKARVEDGTPWVPGEEPKEKKVASKPKPKENKAKSEPTKRQLKEAAAAEAETKAETEAKPKAKPKTKIEPDPVTASEPIVAPESESE